jgi:hypothetical protein
VRGVGNLLHRVFGGSEIGDNRRRDLIHEMLRRGGSGA